MSRIPETEIERIKKETDLAELVKRKGIELKKHGSNLVGLCPFHNDTDPSLVVTPSKNLWHCMGACQSGGTVIDWVMKTEGVGFRHAVEILREGKEISNTILKRTTVRNLECPLDSEADQQTILSQSVAYYHSVLLQSPAAIEYLEKRGIYDPAAIEQFNIGFADRTIGLRIPERNRREGKTLREKLVAAGLFRESGHEHFNGAIVFPITSADGTITEIYGRKITAGLKKNIPLHIYLPGPHKGIFNLSCFAAAKEYNNSLILCESIIDALSFYVHGFPNVTCSYGVEGFTDELFQAIISSGVTRIYIAYDRDTAGDTAANRLVDRLSKHSIECLRIQFPKNMDANEYICSVKPPAEALKILVNSAIWLAGKPAKAVSSLAAAAVSENPAEQKEPSQTQDSQTVPASSPVPAAPDLPYSKNGDDISITAGDRQYRVRGLERNKSFDVLRINLKISVSGLFFLDTVDLYNHKNRTGFIASASDETGVDRDILKRDLGKILLLLEHIQLESMKESEPVKPQMNANERHEAIAFLRDPHILSNIEKDFVKCGMVGEGINALTGYLATISRKLDDPLAVIIQSSSAAGKTSLMDAILAFEPPEDRIKYTSMSGQSLFYMENDLMHKTLAISEEEGAEKAVYAIKTMQSEKILCMASTGKDAQSGRLTTHEYSVEGPVQIIFTTTSAEINEELQNRCIILTVNENREQTQAIHRMQREKETLEGMIMKSDKEHILNLHRNAQRLLKPIMVVNPYAPHLTFLDNRLRTRRDHTKYLTLIRTIALLKQYQKELKQTEHNGKLLEYIEVDLQDIEEANRLANVIFGSCLDELAPQTRRLLDGICEMVQGACSKTNIEQSDYRFTRRDVREYLRWGNTQIKIHMDRLADMEYIISHRGRNGQAYLYELLYKGEGKAGAPFLMGLIDTTALKKKA